MARKKTKRRRKVKRNKVWDLVGTDHAMTCFHKHILFCHMATLSEGVGFLFVGYRLMLTPYCLNDEFRIPGRFTAQARTAMQIESEFWIAAKAMRDDDLGAEGLGEGDPVRGYELAAMAVAAGFLEPEDLEAVHRSLTPQEREQAQEMQPNAA